MRRPRRKRRRNYDRWRHHAESRTLRSGADPGRRLGLDAHLADGEQAGEHSRIRDRQGAERLQSPLAMDAYQHVKPNTPYPAVLLTTGANDPRVAPWQAAKMTAPLQASTNSGKPVLLRVDYDAGHGIGSTNRSATWNWLTKSPSVSGSWGTRTSSLRKQRNRRSGRALT